MTPDRLTPTTETRTETLLSNRPVPSPTFVLDLSRLSSRMSSLGSLETLVKILFFFLEHNRPQFNRRLTTLPTIESLGLIKQRKRYFKTTDYELRNPLSDVTCNSFRLSTIRTNRHTKDRFLVYQRSFLLGIKRSQDKYEHVGLAQ